MGNWSPETLTGKTGVPGIMQDGVGELEMVYRGTDSYIYRTFSSNGATWKDRSSTTPQTPIPFEWYSAADWVFYIGMNSRLYTHIE